VLVQREMESGRSPLVSITRVSGVQGRSGGGCKLVSNEVRWLVSSNHAHLTPQKRSWLGKESIPLESEAAAAAASFGKRLATRPELCRCRHPETLYD
jgi:hypothetical protein